LPLSHDPPSTIPFLPSLLDPRSPDLVLATAARATDRDLGMEQRHPLATGGDLGADVLDNSMVNYSALISIEIAVFAQIDSFIGTKGQVLLPKWPGRSDLFSCADQPKHLWEHAR
jgi:hypothetical protein